MSSRSKPSGQAYEAATAQAIEANFNGDAALFHEFAAVCKAQFGDDANAGQAACDAHDLVALRAVAHNLKSALRMLGQARMADLASQVESSADAGALESACLAWRTMHPALLRLLGKLPVATAPPPPPAAWRH
jgi:HPt (histidine-containing phosphotransfer) domain-containing protein